MSHGEAMRQELDMDPVEWIGGERPGALTCRDDVLTDVRGEFSMTWSSASLPRPGQSLDIILNGQPWMPNPLLGSAGISDQDSSSAQLSYLSPQPGGEIVVLALTIPLSFFNVGEHPMHGIETNGFLEQIRSHHEFS